MLSSDHHCRDLLMLYNQQQNRQSIPEEGEEYRAETAESSDSATEIEVDGDQEESTRTVQREVRDDSVCPQNCSEESSRSRGKRRRILSDVCCCHRDMHLYSMKCCCLI